MFLIINESINNTKIDNFEIHGCLIVIDWKEEMDRKYSTQGPWLCCDQEPNIFLLCLT